MRNQTAMNKVASITTSKRQGPSHVALSPEELIAELEQPFLGDDTLRIITEPLPARFAASAQVPTLSQLHEDAPPDAHMTHLGSIPR